jgi:gliding motility-associated-like protein
VQLILSNFKDDTTFLTDTICQRSTKFFNGNTINLEGIYWDTFKNKRNCDSFISLQLVHFKNDTTYLTDTICHHGTRLFNSESISLQGVYWDTFLDSDHGCDSFIHFTLVHYPRDTGLDTGYICLNDSFWFNGLFRKTTQIYWDTLPNLKHSCDSIIKFSLILREPPLFKIRTTVCNGSIVPFHGIPYSQDTIVWDTTRSKIHGCDSFTQFKLKYNDQDTDFHKHIICRGDSHYFNNKFLKASGIYWDSFVNIYTCDSFIIDTLQVLDPDSTFYSDTICYGDGYLFNNQILSVEGDYRDSLKNRYLCDSFIFLHLFVFPKPIGDTLNHIGCKSVIIHTISYSSTQQFSETIKNAAGCDSIYRLHMIRIKPVPILVHPKVISYCDTFISQGKKYYSSGSFMDTVRTRDTLNCDSVYVPLVLTRRVSPDLSIHTTPKRSIYRKGDAIELLVKKASTYLWNTGDTAHRIFEKLLKDTFVYRVIGWSEYYIENLDTIYCRDTAYMKIITNDSAIARVPTAFTPNGDGINDIIYCRGYGIEKLLSFRIYNRLGQLLFLSTTIEDGWNGYYKELLQNSDTYYYTYEAESYGGKRVKGEGNFLLLR